MPFPVDPTPSVSFFLSLTVDIVLQLDGDDDRGKKPFFFAASVLFVHVLSCWGSGTTVTNSTLTLIRNTTREGACWAPTGKKKKFCPLDAILSRKKVRAPHEKHIKS